MDIQKSVRIQNPISQLTSSAFIAVHKTRWFLPPPAHKQESWSIMVRAREVNLKTMWSEYQALITSSEVFANERKLDYIS